MGLGSAFVCAVIIVLEQAHEDGIAKRLTAALS